MALPETVYAYATATNPSATLTDFSLAVDLSLMPAAWWTLVDTVDGTKGRAAKDDGTELACDWIDFNNNGDGTGTGLLRVKWESTLATTGSQILRVYPPMDANAAVAAGDTYGSDAAYDLGYQCYIPDGLGVDRTVNGNDFTAVGSPTVGGSAGPIGAATDLNGSSQLGSAPSMLASEPEEVLICMWINPDSVAFCFLHGQDPTLFNGFFLGGKVYLIGTNTSEDSISLSAPSNLTFDTSGWQMYSVRWSASTTLLEAFRNATKSSGSANTSGEGLRDMDQTMAIGAAQTGTPANYFDGDVAQISFHRAIRTDAWVALEYAQLASNTTFWGEWAMFEASADVAFRNRIDRWRGRPSRPYDLLERLT